MKAVVDANLWIARVLRDDRFHVESSRWLNDWFRLGHEVAVPTLLLSELSGGLARQTGHPDIGLAAVADLYIFPRFGTVDLDESLARAAAHLAADLRLRGADAVYAALAQRLGVPY